MTKPAPVLTLADGYPFNLQSLLVSRILATAASGSGKSWLMRRIIEQALPHVQVFIIDPEGEFHTLREKFEILVCAPEGADAVATPETAPLLVRYLLETATEDRLGASAVFNISDLKSGERQDFVRNFCNAMVNSARPLWHNVLVVIDEAHVFCPEGSRTESGQAIIDLATRGRKRGFGLMLATQRLVKLHKDAAGEMLNKLIGRTSLPNDIRRAADELGETPKEMAGKLRGLDRGEWYAYGPAFPDGIQRLKVGPVATTHPEPGNRFLSAAAAPGPKIRALLAERLKDLPQKAAEEATTLDQVKAQLEESRETVRRLTNQQPQPNGVPEPEVRRRVNEAFDEGVATAIGPARKLRQGLQDLLNSVVIDVENPNKLLADALKGPAGVWEPDGAPDILADIREGDRILRTGGHSVGKQEHVRHNSGALVEKVHGKGPVVTYGGTSGPQQTLLNTLMQFEMYGHHPMERKLLAIQSGASFRSSGFEKNISTLRTKGLIQYPNGGTVLLTDEGRKLAKYPAQARTIAEYHSAWCAMISGPQAAILRFLISIYKGEPVSRENLAAAVNASSKSSGFEKNVSTLHTMGAIDYPKLGHVKASATMFPKGVKP